MSRIDELQRLHEAAAEGFLDTRLGMACTEDVRDAIVALHNSWPAIYRVLLAARKLVDIPNNTMAAVVAEADLIEALRALDGDKETP